MEKHTTSEHIKDQITTEITNFLHTCIYCEFHTNDYDVLNEHIDITHRNRRSSFKCENCDEFFDNQLKFEWHKETEHESTMLIECSIGTDISNAENELNMNMTDIHVTHDCLVCQQKFSSNHDLEKHTCVAGQHIKCDQCDYTATNVSALVTHLLTIHNNKISMHSLLSVCKT